MKVRRIGTAIAAIAVLGAGLLQATPAGAVFPGSNGRIAFSRETSAGWEIFTMTGAGNDLVRLTNNTVRDDYPSWSPDGTKIAFMRKMNTDGSQEIFVMNADGSGQVRLTNNSVNDADPNWSPDGATIVFSRRINNDDWELMKMDADGSHVVRLTDNNTQDYSPVFSPDGTLLAFSGTSGGVLQVTTMTPAAFHFPVEKPANVWGA